MTSKESALQQLMQDEGYTLGTTNLTLHLLGDKKEALDELILFISDEHPNEEDFIEQLSEVCEKVEIEF